MVVVVILGIWGVGGIVIWVVVMTAVVMVAVVMRSN